MFQTWKSLPDSNEVTQSFPSLVVPNVDATVELLASNNVFFIAKRHLKDTDQEVLYLSVKVAPAIPLLIELTFTLNVPGVKCAVKAPNPEMAPLFFEAIESLLK